MDDSLGRGSGGLNSVHPTISVYVSEIGISLEADDEDGRKEGRQ